MTDENDAQRTRGRIIACCVSMVWALNTGYIKKGFLWHDDKGRIWIPWTFVLTGPGWKETSPIHFCPFCGTCLDKPEE